MADVKIYVDDTLQKQAELVLTDIGLNLSTAMALFLKQVVRCNGIPFELRADPFYSAENQARLLNAKEQMEHGGGTVHELLEVDETFRDTGAAGSTKRTGLTTVLLTVESKFCNADLTIDNNREYESGDHSMVSRFIKQNFQWKNRF